MDVFGTFLQTLTAVVLLFAGLSWVSFKIVEIWHIIVNRHGVRLHAELAHCFGDEKAGRFTSYFYWHPLIQSFSQPPSAWFGRIARQAVSKDDPEPFGAFPPGRKPGHIAPDTFAAFMLDPFPWPSTQDALARMLAANRTVDDEGAPPMTDEALAALAAKLLEQPHDPRLDMSWADLLGADKVHFHPAFNATKVDIYADRADSALATPLARLKQAWDGNQLAPPALRSIMSSLVREAEDDVDQLRGAVARWYREAMDRATGRFQRASMRAAFVVAVLICVGLNVNLLSIGEALITALRSPSPEPMAGHELFELASWAELTWSELLHRIVGVFLAGALAALGAPFWYDLLGKISRRSGRGPTPRREGA